jgi:phosphoserine phosphatase
VEPILNVSSLSRKERAVLHVFDMDGTLLHGTTAGLEIARRLGCVSELVELEASFASGTIDTRAFSAAIAALWQGITAEVVAEVFHASPWISGLPDVLADIRRRGEHSLVITMSPDFFADGLRVFGVDEVAASRFPALPLSSIPDPAWILTPDDKVRIVVEAMARLGLTERSCIAYGDSGSDVPLFRRLPHTVAVNATPELVALAAVSYQGADLREAYRLARSTLGPGPRAASIS